MFHSLSFFIKGFVAVAVLSQFIVHTAFSI